MTLKEILDKNSALFGGANQNYGIKNYSLPNGGGSYSAAGTSTPMVGMSKPGLNYSPAPGNTAPIVQTPAVSTTPTTPIKTTTPTRTFTGGVTTPTTPTPTTDPYAKYRDPVSGKILTPDEFANMMATKARGGQVPSYAGDAITKPNQSIEELNRTATGLNNAANDIATGETDPYGIAGQSGIPFNPVEREAIQKAYAGVYSPALTDVFTKIDTKQKEAANALQLKNDLSKIEAQNKNEMAKIAQQHKYAMDEKSAPSYADLHNGIVGGTYVPGANPVVDAWAERINNQSAKMTDIKDQATRNAVAVALQSQGNQLNGKPTTTELGKAALANAKALMAKVNSGTGTNAVGASRLWGGGALGAAMPGTPGYGFANDFNAIKSQLSLEAVKYLKGQGQVSDAERALLAQAATKLNLSQDETEFKQTLQEIINKLETGNIEGTTSGGNVTTAPDGTAIEITD